jgi:hypothetical protein
MLKVIRGFVMARFKDKDNAIKLRLRGKSYSQIKKAINVSKSTLSYWLRDYPLSEERIREIRDKNPRRIEKYRATRLRQKQERLNKVYLEEKKKILPFNKRDLFIAGLFLYWGEGTKTTITQISVSNTNPAVIKFFIKWLVEFLSVPQEKIKIYLHLYNDMDINKEINFWSKELRISKKQFRKPYIKASSKQFVAYKSKFNHGTCNAIVGDARLMERILAGLKVIEDSLNS